MIFRLNVQELSPREKFEQDRRMWEAEEAAAVAEAERTREEKNSAREGGNGRSTFTVSLLDAWQLP